MILSFLSLVVLLNLSFGGCQSHSGLKFGIDTNVLKMLNKVDLNRFLQNKTIASDMHMESSSFPSYKIGLDMLKVSSVVNPSSVSVNTVDTATTSLNVKISGVKVALTASLNVKVLSLFSDVLVDSPVLISLDDFEAEFTFVDGLINFSKLNLIIADIDIQFNSVVFKTIYNMGKSLIVKMINSQLGDIKSVLEVAVNKMITSEAVIDLTMGIGLNMTNTDRPKLVSHIQKNAKNFNLNFLGEATDQEVNAANLQFGVHGAIFPNQSPSKADVEPAVNMNYIEKTFDNDISLLVSDYTLNTLFFMVQQTGMLSKRFDNDTRSFLPMNVDTDSIAAFIPELKNVYKENKLMEVKVYVNALDHVQPKINTNVDGSTFNLNFAVEFNVFNGDPWDDADKALKVDVNAHFKVQYFVSNNKLNLICFRVVLDNLDKKFDAIDANIDNLKTSLDGLFNDMFKTFKPQMSNIDVFGKLAESFNVTMSNMFIMTDEKYLALSVNVDEF